MSEAAVVAVVLTLLTIDGILYALDGARKRHAQNLQDELAALSARVDQLDGTAERNRRWGRR